VLLVDYDHSRGGELAIYSPGASTEVVGTLFSVRVDQGTSRVAVARGALRVHAAGGVVALGASQALVASTHAPVAISAGEDRALRDHARSLMPPPAEHGIIGVTGSRLRAEIAGQLLADTPLWALLPAGSNTITLRDSAQRKRELHSSVRPRERTEIVLAPQPGPAASKTPRASPSDSLSSSPSSEPSPAAEQHAPLAADELYRAAEAAMRSAEQRHASELLAELVRTHANAPSVDLALYDLAQIAFREADYGSAHAWLARLDSRGARAALRDPAHYLRCRVAHARGQAGEYEACLEQFRATFSKSPRADEVLATLAVLRFDRDGCAAKALLDEYLTSHPRGGSAKQIRKRRERCGP
jgi:hypothetical protein